MSTPQDVLRTSIETHNDTFESLLKLIPPKYYLVNEDDPDTAVRSGKYHISRSWIRLVCPGHQQIPKTQQEQKSTQASGQRGVQESQTRKGVWFSVPTVRAR